MLSKAALLLDPGALAIVLVGTVLATLARCGWRNIRTALRAVARLPRPGYDIDPNRIALARAATAIHEKGHLCAETELPPDPATARLVEAVLVSGSVQTLQALARTHRTAREITRIEAQRAFEYAGELAPVFGLVGTLFAITQLAPNAVTGTTETTMAALATAVLSTLYGVLTAHLAFVPIARLIERHGEREEQARASLIEWFEEELARVRPHRHASREHGNHDAARDAA